MQRPLSLLLAALLLTLTGCGSQPPQQPQPAPEPPLADPVPQVPENSTPPTPIPAEEAQLPATPPSITLEPQQVSQGDFAILRVDRPLEGEIHLSVEGLAEQPKLYLVDEGALALIGFPSAAGVGSYPVNLTWSGGSWDGQIEVVYKEFTVDRLDVSEEQENLYYDPRQAEEWARIFSLRSTSEPIPLWAGPFQMPLAGELMITTYFGEIRVVNGVETGRHSGMDFGADTGTPILAPARGKVILAEDLIVTGRTIILDHGLNLFTAYYHCEELSVAPEDWVEPGQQIGLVGSTGFSTGPHLHWTATVGNTPVDPWPLTQEVLGEGPGHRVGPPPG